MKFKLASLIFCLLSSNPLLAKNYDLSDFFTQNYDFTAQIKVIPNNVKTVWESKTRVTNKSADLTEVENKDYQNGQITDIEYYWYNKNGIATKYKNKTTTCSIKENNSTLSFKSTKIGSGGSSPILYCSNGERIKTTWKLKGDSSSPTFILTNTYIKNGSITETNEYQYTLNEKAKIKSFVFNFYQGNKSFHLLEVKSEKIIYIPK